MGDLLVGIVLMIGLSFIVKFLFFKPKKGNYPVCAGCTSGSCSTCDPVDLKEQLKHHLHSH